MKTTGQPKLLLDPWQSVTGSVIGAVIVTFTITVSGVLFKKRRGTTTPSKMICACLGLGYGLESHVRLKIKFKVRGKGFSSG